MQMKQGRPAGVKDGVPRQRPLAHPTLSDSSQSSSSETASEASSQLDSVSTSDCESSLSQVSSQRKPAPSSQEPYTNGLLFNQAIIALLRQGIQQPPPLDTPSNSSISPMQQSFPSFFNALHLPPVPPFTSPHAHQAPASSDLPTRSDLLLSAASHASSSSIAQASCAGSHPSRALPLATTPQTSHTPTPLAVSSASSWLPLPMRRAQNAPQPPLSQTNLALAPPPRQLFSLLNSRAAPCPEVAHKSASPPPPLAPSSSSTTGSEGARHGLVLPRTALVSLAGTDVFQRVRREGAGAK
eukprot:1679185-Rhodomonas_salina.1